MDEEHEGTDQLSIRIDEKLSSFSTVSSPMCFKVPNLLRQTNEKAYEPYMISIGPYHHGKDHLKGMEAHKMHYLKRLLRRRKETSVHRYVMALKGMEDEIRKCYAEPLDIGGDALVEMMLLDGCFIIELIRNFGKSREGNDDFRNFSVVSVYRDLLLVENQLPFSVLSELDRVTLGPNRENDFIDVALDFFSKLIPGPGIRRPSVISDQIIKNLLSLVHDNWLPSPEVEDSYSKNSAVDGEWSRIHNAEELQEAGIKFKKMIGDHQVKSLFDIKFENGVLWIPTIRVGDDTESILRNLIAYEQCHDHCSRYVTDYVTFMDCLINSEQDVKLLGRSRAIDNLLGDDKVVANTFNTLGDSVELIDTYFYWEIFTKVREHCDRKRNVWMAKLWNDYFNTPWAMISFLAGVFLLIFTAVQTIYSVLSYY